MDAVSGRPGELRDRLLDLIDRPGPQLRAVATTLLIKGLDLGDIEFELMEAMVASDEAAFIIDPAAAGAAGLRLRDRLAAGLDDLAVRHDEPSVVRTMRDYLVTQIRRWATRAVDNTATRRQAERFLAWAERPGQLAAAQERGLFVGMDVGDFRRLAGSRTGDPVTPETALGVWTQVDNWLTAVDANLGDPVLAAWQAAASGY
jgi:hypothetical protein